LGASPYLWANLKSDKMKKTAFPLLPIFLLWMACGQETAKKPADGTTPRESPAASNLPPATYLEGLYATSTAAGKGVENLFDGNPATTWQTLPGTGPDEGVMLYFQEPMDIASVEIVAEAGNIAKVAAKVDLPIQVYANGQISTSGNPNEPIALAQKGPVKSLFIRFYATGKEENQTIKEDLYRLAYPADAYIAVSELKILNTKGETLRLAPPLSVNGRVSASSTLAPESAYNPANLFDSRKEFVWVEGVASSGEEEVLTFEFDQPVEITAIQVRNGYQRSEEHFSANARVRDFQFQEKSSQPRTYSLGDTKQGQKISLAQPEKGSVFELRIKSVYPGKKYKDLAISDIVFYNGNQPFVLHSSTSDKYKAELKTKASSSVISAWLDKRIANYIEDGASSTTQSLILRSDGTFVMYSEAYSDGDPDVLSFADGNWELLSKSQVKIFGNWTDLVNLPEYYQGVNQQSPSRIFNDVLNIDAKKVVGTKMLGTFYLK
jgi:hypothetical protein